MKPLIKQYLNTVTCWYIVFYAIYSISTRFLPTAVLCEGLPADLLYKTIIIGAGLLALAHIILLLRSVRPDKFMLLLAVFIVILGISAFTNRQYEFAGNITGIATFAAQLIVFCFLPQVMSENELSLCLIRTAFFSSFFWTPGCAFSLYQYIVNMHYITQSPEGRMVRQGIADGRLFGLFSDPNFAAFTSLIIILLLIYAMKRCKNETLLHTKFQKPFFIYGIVCIVINLAYLIMSNSRTIYIAAVGTLLFFVLMRTYRLHRESGTTDRIQFLRDLVKKTALALAAVVAIYAVIFFPLRGIGYLIAPDRDINDMVREDVNIENITNNRSTIWQHYLKLYTDKPVFGFSVRSALPYATEKYPGSYLAETQYVTHNSYLSLLVETGLTGFTVMGAFFILFFLHSLKRVQKKEAVSDSYFLFAALTVSVLLFMAAFHDIFFTVNIETMLLFTGIGYIIHANESVPQSAISTD